ncbi:MAG: hypothetical protein LLG16_02615 [Euryarchaeota archaeon]|nr:hypothetical protein [Euryarchaeota archaeon]
MELGNLSYGITLYIYAIGIELDDNYISEGNDPWSDYPIPFIPLKSWQLVAAVIIFIFLVIITRGRILFFLPFLFSGRGRGGFGGGGTGGGGSRGRY